MSGPKPRAGLGEDGRQAAEGDFVACRHGARDPLALGEDVGCDEPSGRLVEEAADGRVDHLGEEEFKAVRVKLAHLLGIAGRGGEQPAGDGDTVQRAAQRGQAVGGADPGLGARGLDRGAPVL